MRPFWAALAVVAVVLAVAGYYAATWPGFYPKAVTVSGNRVVSSAEILQRAAIAPHANIWLQNTHAAAARIEAIPYVKEARVHRLLPASVGITVSERKPFAVLEYGGQRALVDGDLRVLQPSAGPSMLPLIAGGKSAMPRPGAFVEDPSVQRLRDDYEALTEAHVAVRSVRYDKFGDLVATMRNGIDLLLGDDGDLAKKTPLIDPIVSQVGATGRKLAAVDLRAPNTPVVVYKH